MMLNIVVLPAPFGPIRPTTPPAGTSNDTLSSARMPPNRMLTPLTDRSGVSMYGQFKDAAPPVKFGASGASVPRLGHLRGFVGARGPRAGKRRLAAGRGCGGRGGRRLLRDGRLGCRRRRRIARRGRQLDSLIQRAVGLVEAVVGDVDLGLGLGSARQAAHP